MTTVTLPEYYPAVMLVVGPLMFITNFMMGGKVMSARTKYKVGYPNLCALD